MYFSVKESPQVELVYHVFIFFVNWTKTEQQQYIKKFYDEKQKTNLKKLINNLIKKLLMKMIT
jgi:hypothetical protein